VRYFTSHFASGLRDRGLSVITADEIGTLLGVERQRQLLGCADGASECLMELSNALGADATAHGTVAFIGGEYAVNITVLSNAGKVLAQYDTRGRDERGVLDALEEAATKISDTLRAGPQNPSRFHARSVVPFVLGTIVAIAGGVPVKISRKHSAPFCRKIPPSAVTAHASAPATATSRYVSPVSCGHGSGIAVLGVNRSRALPDAGLRADGDG
jgi:hypothetical protein